MDRAPTARRVLLLQGPRSPFFARLADALAARGAAVERVLFCAGDALFWRGRRAIRWGGTLAEWPAGFARILRETGATDVVALGDGRPVHALALPEARRVGALTHVVEQGWLRPGWLTVEPDALGAWRPGPRPAPAPAEPPRFRASFSAFAAMDVAWHLANLAGRGAFPHYRSHELASPGREWAGWALKALRWPLRRAGRARALARAARAEGPVFLLALQLETDFQIRRWLPGGLPAMVAETVASFARAAPPGALLLVKPHPLDPGLADWGRLARGPGVVLLDGGSAEALAPRLAGVVTANSTLGLGMLRLGVPVAARAPAVWESLAWTGPLDGFWTAAAPPDPARVAGFVARLAADTQVWGAFDGEGMAVGAAGVAERILGRRPAAAAA